MVDNNMAQDDIAESTDTTNEERPSNYKTGRRNLLKTTGVGMLAITGLRSVSGSVSSEHELIEDWNDLNAMRSGTDGTNYRLAADLDADTAGYNEHVNDPAGGWEPIDGPDLPSPWSLNGNGHTISDLVINRPDESGIGLFGELLEGRLENLAIREANITGGGGVGGLVGSSDNIEISNSSVSGTISGDSSIGGLVGSDTGSTITNSYVTGAVTGIRTVGGLVGFVSSNTEISESFVTASVSGESTVGGLFGAGLDPLVTESFTSGNVSGGQNVGGLVGNYATGGFIAESYATGTVTGEEKIGGLVGEMSESNCTIRQSYATGSVSGTTDVGGLAGRGPSGGGGFVEDSYAAGSVSGDEAVGGILGGEGLNIESTYWDVSATGQTESGGIGETGAGFGTVDDEPPADEMIGTDAIENMQGFDFEDTWAVVTYPDDYPVLRALANRDGVVVSVDHPATVPPNGAIEVTITTVNSSRTVVAFETDDFEIEVSSEDCRTVQNNRVEFPGRGIGVSTDTIGVIVNGGAAGNTGTITTWVNAQTRDEADDVEVSSFEIQREGSPANFTVRIDTTNSPVVAGNPLEVTAAIENIGPVQATQEIELDVDGIDTTSTSVTLDRGESTTERLSIETKPGDAGNYSATVSSNDTSESTRVIVIEAEQEPVYWQVDFGAGAEPPSPPSYWPDDVMAALGNSADGVTQSLSLRRQLTDGQLRDVEILSDGFVFDDQENPTMASVEFEIDEDGPARALHLAAFTLPGPFDEDTIDQQELADSATGRYDAGETGTLTVSLPQPQGD